MIPVEASFESYKDTVYRLALSYTKSKADAEDVCQTVFLKLMEQRVPPANTKAWLMQVTANTCRNLLRSSWWRKTEMLDESIPAALPESLSDIYLTVMSMKPRYRVVIYLHYYEEYSTKEIADLLKISQTTVTTRLSRGRESLRNILKEEYR